MELLLMLPEGKPPFIAIGFSTPGEAALLNCDLVNSSQVKRPCKLAIELYSKKFINVKLMCEDLVTVRHYPHVICDFDKLKSWLFITRNEKKFKFAHIQITNGKYEIPYADKSNKKFALNVNSIEVIGERDDRPVAKGIIRDSWSSPT